MSIKHIVFFALLFTACFAVPPYDVWDLPAIRNHSTMDVETLWTADTSFTDILTFAPQDLKVGEIRFNSYGGVDTTIRIQAFFAYPPDDTSMAGLIVNHGIGMDGELIMAMGAAAAMRCFALAISAPGHGASEGRSAYDFANVVTTYPDVRKNWFYQFGYATMRAVNYLEDVSIVENDWICLLGFSAGATAGILANSVDRRLRITFPVVPQTDYAVGVAESTWIYDIFRLSGSVFDDSTRVYMQNYISPVAHLGNLCGFVTFICGAQDEFDPTTTFPASYALCNPESTRLEVVFDFDHHIYYASGEYSGLYDSYDNSLTFYARLYGVGASVLAMKRAGLNIPRLPTVTATIDPSGIIFEADVPSYFWATNNVKVYVSIDSAWTYTGYPMTRAATYPYHYFCTVPIFSPHNLSNIIYFVDAGGPPYLWLSSIPYAPEGMRARIRPFPEDYFSIEEYAFANVPQDIYVTAYPNPFNSSCTIEAPDDALLTILDLNGRVVARLDKNQKTWVPQSGSGVYYVQAFSEKLGTTYKTILFIK